MSYAQHDDELMTEPSKFSFPPDLQDPILSARCYRLVKKLGKCTFRRVFLAWDERRQYT
jgi:hypothetical protein